MKAEPILELLASIPWTILWEQIRHYIFWNSLLLYFWLYCDCICILKILFHFVLCFKKNSPCTLYWHLCWYNCIMCCLIISMAEKHIILCVLVSNEHWYKRIENFSLIWCCNLLLNIFFKWISYWVEFIEYLKQSMSDFKLPYLGWTFGWCVSVYGTKHFEPLAIETANMVCILN